MWKVLRVIPVEANLWAILLFGLTCTVVPANDSQHASSEHENTVFAAEQIAKARGLMR